MPANLDPDLTTETGARKFVSLCEQNTWEDVLAVEKVDDKVAALDRFIDKSLDLCFPFVTVTRRATDPPWVNDTLKRMAKKRRKVYDKHGRCKRWRQLKKKCEAIYRDRAQKYVIRQKELLTGPDAARAFYKHVRAYSSKEKPPDFDPCDLFPNETPAAVAEKLVEHYNKVSQEFNGLNKYDIPVAPSQPLPTLTTIDVRDRLLEAKKKSMVDGDLLPGLVNKSASFISYPLASIFYAISKDFKWPAAWKVETVTPIPKKPHPVSPDDTRNISCTRLFSKVYESFVLSWLTGTCDLRPNQYGGVKGCGTEHFLVELWQNVLQGLDDSRAGVMLSSIDYSKAFNRLDFSRCLKALKAKGVGQELINIIASFLTDRQMTVKVGMTRSKLRKILGGVPQGSLLGVFLFNCTIDTFEAFSGHVRQYGTQPQEPLSLEELHLVPPDIDVTPAGNLRDHKHLPPFRHCPLTVQKYLDDNIIVELINFDTIATDGYTFRTIQAVRSQNVFQQIVARALICGMKVNATKTSSLLISEVKSYIPKSYFYDADNNKITSGNNMKVLGFHLSSAPDMTAQVESIRRKFRTRVWILRHLAHCGLKPPDLVKVYRSVILPCHDYCSVVYHSSLTCAQSDQLERLQSQALKSIFGYEHSYRSLLEMTGLQSLRERREARFTKFAVKAASNPRYAGWFPRVQHSRTLRSRPPYQEFQARTSRLFNSPLYDLRRRLNAISR